MINNADNTNLKHENSFDEHGNLLNKNDFFRRGLVGIFKSNAENNN